MRAISFCTYAGGFVEGAQWHFDVLANYEPEHNYTETFKANHPLVEHIVFKDLWEFNDYGQIDYIFGNPPCAMFSVANSNKKENDPRFSHHYLGIHLIRHYQPKVFVSESVMGILKKGKWLLDKYQQEGYKMTLFKHNTKYLGVPQNRKRVFIILSQYELEWSTISRPFTVGDVIKDVPHPGRQDIYSRTCQSHLDLFGDQLLPGQNMTKVWDKEIEPRHPSLGIYRMDFDKPSNVLMGYGKIHPTENRWLGINELKRIGTYPDTYEFKGNPKTWAAQMGQAVQPAAGEWISKMAHDTIQSARPVIDTSMTVVDINELILL